LDPAYFLIFFWGCEVYQSLRNEQQHHTKHKFYTNIQQDLTRVRALIQVKAGDKVQYDSPTFGEWMDAHVKEVLPNGLISLDIRDDADPSRIYVPLDVHPSMIRQIKDAGTVEGGGYIATSEKTDDYFYNEDLLEPEEDV